MTAPQNPETAAREALAASASQKLTFEEMVAIRQTVEAALRPTASPGEVTVTEAEPFAWFKTDVNGKPIAFVHHSFDAEVLREQGYALTPVYKTPPALTAALSARPTAPDAEAWRVVPAKATDFMIDSGIMAFNERVSDPTNRHILQQAWTAMLRTAPPALRATIQTETEVDDDR